MMKKQIIFAACAIFLLTGCNLYKPYERPEVKTSGIYRNAISTPDSLVSDTTNMGNLPWKEVFTDSKLQVLIEKGLANNTNLQVARLRIDEAQASLMSARFAFLPSLAFSPQGTISSFNGNTPSKIYSLPVTASWEISLFGDLQNAKRQAKVGLLQSEAYRQAVQTQLIANIANCYFTLLMLDNQLAITEQTAKNWETNVQTMKLLKKAGMTNEAAVAQYEANFYKVSATLPDLHRQIRETENTLSQLLGQTPREIDRGELASQTMPAKLSVGIPVQLLSNRPDVKEAEMALASTYYDVNRTRAAFYPGINLNATGSWTNSGGGIIVNPGKLLETVVGSLTQPLFYRGANKARLKIAKAQQQEAMLAFRQTILNAGNEVSNALFNYHTAGEKCELRKLQIESLKSAVDKTQQLMKLGSSTYLEVITAQQSLLEAQLLYVQNNFERIQTVINLYQALGGGR